MALDWSILPVFKASFLSSCLKFFRLLRMKYAYALIVLLCCLLMACSEEKKEPLPELPPAPASAAAPASTDPADPWPSMFCISCEVFDDCPHAHKASPSMPTDINAQKQLFNLPPRFFDHRVTTLRSQGVLVQLPTAFTPCSSNNPPAPSCHWDSHRIRHCHR